MLLKTILNRCHPLQSFVYRRCRFVGDVVEVDVRPRRRSRAVCSICGRRCGTHDTERKARRFTFVPLWGFIVVLLYRMRRVSCPSCGVKVERIPWADGKVRTCNVYRLFLSRWARRLSWAEVATIFGTSWGVVYRAVNWVVAYGLAHRSLDGISAIGVDEIAVWRGHKFMTVVYQIDAGCRRLLWVGRDRTENTLRQFFKMFTKARARTLRFVASDMWAPYLKVIRANAGSALNVLDRFHVVAKLNKAIDEVRAGEARKLEREGFLPLLKHTRWCFLKREENLTGPQRRRLRDVLRYDLKTVRAFLLKQSLAAFWSFLSPTTAGWFLDAWCTRAMRSRLAPMKRFARTLRRHRELLLNWFHARKEISMGVVEGLNLNAKFALRKARGFRTEHVMKAALYHQLGRLPEPNYAHEFCR